MVLIKKFPYDLQTALRRLLFQLVTKIVSFLISLMTRNLFGQNNYAVKYRGIQN